MVKLTERQTEPEGSGRFTQPAETSEPAGAAA
jgi:hypothetical protein